jgi:hypothetical protein
MKRCAGIEKAGNVPEPRRPPHRHVHAADRGALIWNRLIY